MILTPNRSRKILHIGQDDLFGQVAGLERHFVGTGHSITPASDKRGPLSIAAQGQLLATVSARRRFDAIVLPVIQFDWPYDRSLLKRRIRALARSVMNQKMLSRRVSRWLRRTADHVIALDRFDTPEVSTDFVQSLPELEFYFKTNLLADDARRGLPDTSPTACQLRFLPYWIASEHYPDPGHVEKDIDIIFIGTINSPERAEGRRVLESLRGRGFRILSPERPVPFEQYQSLTARAWLTLSPQGYGYNGFRHYEAMLLRSVPVINLPDPPVIHDFTDGENALLYQPGQLQQRLEQALSNRQHLAKMASRLREFALEHHSFAAVGGYLADEIFTAVEAKQ